ncbi:hypothetical protein AB0G74_08190 [Streptomyces sp. NPDC020875]|uniref:hypothetical protein n=1 Tax=Streptomyces sp. NPDC020875 TaxID=3154898 RepID=UPI0033C3BFEA
MRLRRANVVITAVAVLAGVGMVTGRMLTSEPDPLDLGPVVIVDHTAPHDDRSRDLSPSASSRPRPSAERLPNGSAGGSGPSASSSGSAPGTPASHGPSAKQPASRQPGGRPVPPLSPPRSDDDRPARPTPGSGEEEENEGEGDDERGDYSERERFQDDFEGDD